VACEFGYLTVPEFAELTVNTLATIRRMRRERGHLYNWYETPTLKPLPPLFVSSVDSGNLVASLWTLQQGCLQLIERPVVRPELAEGFIDHLRVLADLRLFSQRLVARIERKSESKEWANSLLKFPHAALDRISAGNAEVSKHAEDVTWFANQARIRLRAFRQSIVRLVPWMLLDFAELRGDPALLLPDENMPLKDLPEALTRLEARLQVAIESVPASETEHNKRQLLLQRLLSLVSGARMDTVRLIQELQSVAADAGTLADEMGFGFVWNPRRKLLSIGYEKSANEVHSACYDLLASESRIAAFVAIAKDEIPQETWFLLARTHTTDRGHPVLVSWTGTMFEYLMAPLWMRTYPGTLLERSRHGAARSQQEFTASKRIPWGISESAYAKRDDAGNYSYNAFGIPQLAIFHGDVDALVISPYSTFLALDTIPKDALHNLRKMAHDGWFGAYGFYESADYGPSDQIKWRPDYELVRCWMAHHQGMILLALANFLHDGIVQEWFHSHPRVQATELLLHEKPVNYLPSSAAVA